MKQPKAVKNIGKTLWRFLRALISLVVLLFVLFTPTVTGQNTLLVTKAADVSNTQNFGGYSAADAPAISLGGKSPNENQRFNLTNMKPGDKFSEDFNLSIKNPMDATIELKMIRTSAITHFDLAEKINIKIMAKAEKNNATTVFEGTMADFLNNPVTTPISSNSSRLVYNIAVSLPQDLGNDYQAQNFTGDLKWTLTGNTPVANPKTGNKESVLIILSFSLAMSFTLGCLNRNKLVSLSKKMKVNLK